MTRLHVAVLVALVFAFGTAAGNPGGTNIVINEIYPDPVFYYDGAEFIELYNPTAAPIDIQGWVLTGVEYDQLCGGEDLWQFPVGSPINIPAGGYLIIAKDGGDGEDGFFEEFGFYPDFEQYDVVSFDSDSPFVANLILLTDTPAYSDEIQLVGGRGYGVICVSAPSDADVVYLYDGDPSSGPANLVDLVEYMDPSECSTDPCVFPFSDDGADDNAFQGIPYVGNTLGRDPASTDTDMSINDWTMQAPTPGTQNVLNTPPWIRTVRYSPIPPNDSDPTTISAIVTDASGIDSVNVYYSVNGGSWSMLAASTSDSVYTANIPAQTDGDVVDYFVRAIDSLGAKINYPGAGFADPYSFRTGITPITSIQTVPAGGDASPLVGQPVNVRGVVTVGTDVVRDDLFYIHDASGQFHGIACYMPGTPTPVQEGDLVTFCGYVTEYYGLTEVGRHFTESMVIESSGNPNYGYTNVTTAQITYNSLNSEPYESQLCRVQNATVTFEPDIYGIWSCRDASAVDCKVDDEAYYSYEPEVLDVLAELRGVLTYDFSEYKMQPRYDEDIIGPPRIRDVRYSPVPPSEASPTTISAVLTDNLGIGWATLHWSLVEARPYPYNLPMTASARYEGTWTAQIPAYPAGTRVYYYVTCVDGSGMDAERPSTGGYSYYTGIESIYNVQFVPPGGDVSPMDTLAVNVEGYVTVEPGIFNANSFYIQNPSGAWNGILVYDRTGTVSFDRGDYVVVCGEVDEYFGQTQIQLHFPEAAQVAGSSGSPDPASLTTGFLQNVVSGEQYESVYVHAEDCTVYDDDLGFGEWAISNGAPADTCRVDDYADYDYVPTNGDNVYVRGVVVYSFGNYKIEPRGNEDIATNPVGIVDHFGGKFGLAQNMPNPFNPKTTIAFTLPQPGDVTLEIYDVAGRRVATLLSGHMDAGPHQVHWDGRTSEGGRAASGVYFYKLSAGGVLESRKMVLLK